MTGWCPNCGRSVEEGEKFCRQCGMPQHLSGEDATTWILSPQPTAETSRETSRVASDTAPATPPTGVAYIPPPATPYQPPPYPQYQPSQTGQPHIALGDWLSGGWQVYKENWALMSLASLLGGTLSLATIGILAGPLLMGMFRMAFKTMRGERPWMSDLFNWQGSFLQAFLAFLIFAVAHGVLTGLGKGPAHAVLSFIVSPFLTVMLGLTMTLIAERRLDVLKAISEVWHLVFSRDALMWWVVGLVVAAISFGGIFACGIGLLVTLPWMISSLAVAHRDVFGMDDPNRTLH